jgi:hypothetical protein
MRLGSDGASHHPGDIRDNMDVSFRLYTILVDKENSILTQNVKLYE